MRQRAEAESEDVESIWVGRECILPSGPPGTESFGAENGDPQRGNSIHGPLTCGDSLEAGPGGAQGGVEFRRVSLGL